MKIKDHWLVQAILKPSPNFDERPNAKDISLIVIHCISLPPKQFGGEYVHQFFLNQLNSQIHPFFKDIEHLKVSAHIFIDRDGQIFQYVGFDKRAWHAGKSCYQGRERCNDFSIGIELEGCDDMPYTQRQYQQLNSLIDTLTVHYPALSREHVTGHSDIAPDRKTDPGKFFDWNKISIKNETD